MLPFKKRYKIEQGNGEIRHLNGEVQHVRKSEERSLSVPNDAESGEPLKVDASEKQCLFEPERYNNEQATRGHEVGKQESQWQVEKEVVLKHNVEEGPESGKEHRKNTERGKRIAEEQKHRGFEGEGPRKGGEAQRLFEQADRERQLFAEKEQQRKLEEARHKEEEKRRLQEDAEKERRQLAERDQQRRGEEGRRKKDERVQKRKQHGDEKSRKVPAEKERKVQDVIGNRWNFMGTETKLSGGRGQPEHGIGSLRILAEVGEKSLFGQLLGAAETEWMEAERHSPGVPYLPDEFGCVPGESERADRQDVQATEQNVDEVISVQNAMVEEVPQLKVYKEAAQSVDALVLPPSLYMPSDTESTSGLSETTLKCFDQKSDLWKEEEVVAAVVIEEVCSDIMETEITPVPYETITSLTLAAVPCPVASSIPSTGHSHEVTMEQVIYSAGNISSPKQLTALEMPGHDPSFSSADSTIECGEPLLILEEVQPVVAVENEELEVSTHSPEDSGKLSYQRTSSRRTSPNGSSKLEKVMTERQQVAFLKRQYENERRKSGQTSAASSESELHNSDTDSNDPTDKPRTSRSSSRAQTPTKADLLASPLSALVGKEDVDTDTFHAGDLVWVKVVGSPWWPAKIASPQGQNQTSIDSVDKCYVFFFGTQTRQWVEEDRVLSFARYYEDKATKCTTRIFKVALKEAQSALSAHKQEAQSAVSASEDVSRYGIGDVSDIAADGVNDDFKTVEPEAVNSKPSKKRKSRLVKRSMLIKERPQSQDSPKKVSPHVKTSKRKQHSAESSDETSSIQRRESNLLSPKNSDRARRASTPATTTTSRCSSSLSISAANNDIDEDTLPASAMSCSDNGGSADSSASSVVTNPVSFPSPRLSKEDWPVSEVLDVSEDTLAIKKEALNKDECPVINMEDVGSQSRGVDATIIGIDDATPIKRDACVGKEEGSLRIKEEGVVSAIEDASVCRSPLTAKSNVGQEAIPTTLRRKEAEVSSRKESVGQNRRDEPSSSKTSDSKTSDILSDSSESRKQGTSHRGEDTLREDRSQRGPLHSKKDAQVPVSRRDSREARSVERINARNEDHSALSRRDARGKGESSTTKRKGDHVGQRESPMPWIDDMQRSSLPHVQFKSASLKASLNDTSRTEVPKSQPVVSSVAAPKPPSITMEPPPLSVAVPHPEPTRLSRPLPSPLPPFQPHPQHIGTFTRFAPSLPPPSMPPHHSMMPLQNHLSQDLMGYPLSSMQPPHQWLQTMLPLGNPPLPPPSNPGMMFGVGSGAPCPPFAPPMSMSVSSSSCAPCFIPSRQQHHFPFSLKPTFNCTAQPQISFGPPPIPNVQSHIHPPRQPFLSLHPVMGNNTLNVPFPPLNSVPPPFGRF